MSAQRKIRKIKFQHDTVLRPDGRYYWHIRAKNGEIISDGQGYKDKRSPLALYKALGYTPETCDFEPVEHI